MIISRTPYRISFFGGGTDYPAWFRTHGGAVLSTTIDKYCWITLRRLPPFFRHKSRILYSKIENVRENSKVKHPSVRACLAHLGVTEGIEIHHDGDLPARTGIGSSSSFTVGLLHALYALRGVMPGKMRLAKEAIHVEQELLRENVGCQDQVIAALGGMQRIVFGPEGAMHMTPVILPQERREALRSRLLLYFTGFSRISSQVVEEQLRRMGEKERDLTRMRAMVDEAVAILAGGGDLADFGRLLDESWRLKRGLSSKVSTPAIDSIYEEARSAGALGGKLLGAGGGGFLMLFAEPGDHARIRKRLSKLLLVPFRFETEGSHIVFYQPEEPSGGGI
ncbi:MAG: kinase [Elusimicrobia bacterium]|nr:kinase [Elusimicrobiota bacterium]